MLVGWLVGQPKNVLNLFQPNVNAGSPKMAVGSWTGRGHTVGVVPTTNPKKSCLENAQPEAGRTLTHRATY